MKTILKIFLLFFSISIYAQTTVKGNVSDESGQPLLGANVIVVGTTSGAVTDFDGNFEIKTNQDPPFTLKVTSVGFADATKEVTENNQTVNFVLKEGNELDEIVISASRTPERIFESPVTVERFGTKEIKTTASVDFYDGLENLKGVDVNTNSLTFKSINTRGFATFANTRFMQLVDGMDNSTPALNFPIGNLVGMTETDVQSVELLPGAASALYGANAFNGILFMTSKNPFDYTGISGSVKRGITSQDAAGDNTYTDIGVRMAHKFSDKFAAKVNFGWLKGTDWAATSEVDKFDPTRTRAHYNYDGINVYGDEVSTNIRAASGLGIIPDVVVSRTGYNESELTDYNAESVKADWGLYFRPWENDFEISYQGKIGTGSTIYQGTNRYYIDNFKQQQHKLEFKNDNFFLRGYVVADKAGDSYDMVFTGVNINNAWKSNEDWFGDYIATYAGIELSGNPQGLTTQQKHDTARAVADTGRFEPGSPEFQNAFNRIIQDPDFATGSKFQDASKYYHADANYNFSHLVDFADIQVGGSFRQYSLNSSGTIYTDYDGNIDYNEYGIYTQIQKDLDLNESLELKLTGSIRYDKSEFFDGFLSPRISAGLTVNRNHNIRASVQTGFRNPTTQDLFIGLDAGRAFLIGAAPDNLERYARTFPVSVEGQNITGATEVTQSGVNAYYNSYQAESVLAFAAAPKDTPQQLAEAIGLLEVANSDLVKPEKVTSAEVGYRGKFNNLTIDFSAYYNKYKDFISQEAVISPFFGFVDGNYLETLPDGSTRPTRQNGDGVVDVDPLALASLGNGDYKIFSNYTNSKVDVSSYGASIGLSVKVLGDFDLSGNYTWSKQDFDEEANPGFVTNFNTPEHKFKASFGNTNLFENFGFNVAYRFSDDYFWEATFGNGLVPEFHTLDAQINYTIPKLKSTFKAGATNLTGKEYFTAFGTGNIGSMYYVSWTINNL